MIVQSIGIRRKLDLIERAGGVDLAEVKIKRSAFALGGKLFARFNVVVSTQHAVTNPWVRRRTSRAGFLVNPANTGFLAEYRASTRTIPTV